MASLRRHPRSPFWYLRFRDLETGKWREECTNLRADDPADTRKAQRKADEHSKRERQVAPRQPGEFEQWVGTYIKTHYHRPGSRQRYALAWDRISEWLKLRSIKHPQQIRYEHAADYLDWRTKMVKHNTARLELKFFAFVMQEARRRDLCESNPLTLAKVPRRAAAEKMDLGDEDFRKARAAMAGGPKWMRIVFEIMAHLGCRFAESCIPLNRIDFAAGIIWLADSKRHETDARKFFAVPLPDGLRPLLEEMKEQITTTPPLTGEMNHRFNKVLKGAVGATSHSLRVSFITRCHRAGLTEIEAMDLVNHSSRMVHRIYSRMSVSDKRRSMDRVAPPPPPAL